MPDLLDETRSSIARRLKELKPLVDEYHRLEHAAAALAGAGERRVRSAATAVAKRKPGRPRRSSATKAAAKPSAKVAARKPAKRRAGRRKGSGTRGAEAAEAVRAQPGITIPELAAKMGIKQNYLYRVMPALQKEGKVSKRGKGWYPKGS